MDAAAIAIVSLAILTWALLSERLGEVDITGPMAFVALGALADAAGLLDVAPNDIPLGIIASGTLALLLFVDASRVNLTRLRGDAGPPARMLGIGLPLTILLGTLAARLLVPDVPWAAALLVAACLAPTDAGLGAVIVNDRRIPLRIRRTLNVESGLNDGIAAPVVTMAIAILAEEEFGTAGLARTALTELGTGALVGIALGAGGGRLLTGASRRGWVGAGATPLAVLALAVLTYTTALTVGGNGFIAAFVAGLAFGSAARGLEEARRAAGDVEDGPPLELAELGGQLLGAVVWFLFGAALLAHVLDELDWRIAAYTVLSLTVVRMVPIALSLLGTGLALPTVAFFGWFGPRGLASLVFAIEAVDELGKEADAVLTAVGFAVLVSVVLHGATARPLASAYARWTEGLAADHPAMAESPSFTPRRWMNRPLSVRGPDPG